MVTESSLSLLTEIGIGPIRGSNERSFGGEDLGFLLRRQESNDREKELNIYRSGSAPPTVEGSLAAVGGIFNGGGEASEDSLRSDPAYLSYYYSNANLNPRLPPPLLSKEDWRFAQRVQSGGSLHGGIGDRRKASMVRGDDNKSLFSVQPGFNEESDAWSRKQQGKASPKWERDGLIGFPGLGLGGRQKSFADIFQEDLGRSAPVSAHPSRPSSRNAFDDNVGTLAFPEAQHAQLHHESAPGDALRTSASASLTYASALGASLSRSTTPDPQLVARAPSPRLPPVGEGRVGSNDKRNIPNSKSFNGVPSSMSDSANLAAALSGMSLSTNGGAEEENRLVSKIQLEIDDQNFLFNLQGGHQDHIKKHQFLDTSHLNPNLSKISAVGKDPYNNSSSHPYINEPSALNLSSAGGSPHYQNVDNINSAYSSYGLNGYSMNPGSPSIMASQLGTANLPPLFENVAAASAMAAQGMDSRAFGGGFPTGLNLSGTEFQNLNRAANNTMPLMDPLYLQYLQVAALNDPSLDVLGLQKAYLGAMFSPQKSQYGVPFAGKSAGLGLNYGYYGSPAYNLGMSYLGNPLMGPILPNSPVGPSSPMRHNDRNFRFHSGMRNLSGGGAWPSEAGNVDERFTSSLLEEFKSNKTRSFELSEIDGYVVEFSSADQYGSRFIQQKLETATTEEKNMVFREIIPQGLSLMTDVFGNYVIQKFFEHGTASQRRELANQLTGHVLTLSLQMYGCRVIQKAIEVVDLDQQKEMVAELNGHIMRCVRDQNGNHVIQKCIECIPQDAIEFIISSFYDQVVTLSTHPYGCRVIQRVLEHCGDPKTQQIMMDEIMKSICMLAQDQYGNYVVQHVLEHGKPHERSAIIKQLAGQIVQMSQQKFASNVVEKCLSFGGPTERQILVSEMLGTTDENEPLQAMMKDQFANYVVQKVLETCDDQQRELILSRIKVHLNALKKYTYGKHIVARVEKLVAAGGSNALS
ncbi:hypothetical protein GIB67_040547 [Kingdonia uniflora]|uniref:PUM-HD domain-containing protein n=1 Tax=Kingdonia uniflora TaxID=39325 RepID=A0A7J7L5K2_9MAGN|nr:hypothetical protein GIB67_040547 [Kingdonia uniflora]